MDNQEVFNDIESDQTIIVELLEEIEDSNLRDAILSHFQEMASLNEARSGEVLSLEQLGDMDVPHFKYGKLSDLLTKKIV